MHGGFETTWTRTSSAINVQELRGIRFPRFCAQGILFLGTFVIATVLFFVNLSFLDGAFFVNAHRHASAFVC